MRHIKLHTKFVILFTAVSLIPLTIVVGVSLLRFQQTLESDAAKLGAQFAATASAEIKSFMVSQLRILDNVATIYHPSFPIERETADQILDNILLESDNFSDISVLNAEGQEIAHKNQLFLITKDDYRDLHDSEAFTLVKEHGIYVGPLYINRGRPFFDFGRQILSSDGTFSGAVFAQVDARVFPAVVEEISQLVEKPGRVYIVNGDGVVIAHPDLSYVLAERNLSELPVVKEAITVAQGKDVVQAYTNESGDKVLGSAHPIVVELFDLRSKEPATLNWHVIVEQPESAVYADARAAAFFLIFMSATAVLLAAIAAVLLAGRVSRPIEALHRAALEFGRGNLKFRAEIVSRDEIGDLAEGFNVMASRVMQTVESLKEEERTTAAERNKLSLILSGITNAVIATDRNHRIILFNKAAEMLTGLHTEGVLDVSIQEVVRLFDEQQELTVAEYCPDADMGVTEGPVFSKNGLKLLDSNGNEHFVNLVTGRIKEGLNADLGCILTFQDVTRDFVMERTKREFVSIAAHQLRTPLTGMSWIAEALLSEVKGKLTDPQKELVKKSVDAVRRMVELVNDLLDVSRIEEGRFGIKPLSQPLYPVLTRLLDIFNKESKRRNITLAIDIAEGLPDLSFDASKIEFAIGNLIDNAIKYTPEGGTVSLRVTQENEQVIITVSDTGIGIPDGEYDRVFTKFFRSKEALAYFTDGSGLGLYVTKNIIDQHGGRVWFESEKGKGTTFHIALSVSAKPSGTDV